MRCFEIIFFVQQIAYTDKLESDRGKPMRFH